jgi:LmbE family N-acetylglucosaminyl deacetylase
MAPTTSARLALGVALTATALACRHWCPPSSRISFRRAPGSFGRRLLVIAPHPDDEVLATGGVIARARRDGDDVDVVAATDGEVGVNRTHAPDLGRAREEETRRALAILGVPPAGIEFLDYADETLAAAWSERWIAARRGAPDVPSTALIEALRASLRAAHPDTVFIPLPLDEHPDHGALGKFSLLAILAEAARPGPRVLGYVVHGHGRSPACRVIGADAPAVPPGCAGFLSWTAVSLDPGAVAGKQALIREYRTQQGSTLLRYARSHEIFAADLAIDVGRAASPWRPGIRRRGRSVEITVPRDACVMDPAAGDRLRLRYVRGGAIEERVVALAQLRQLR